MVGGGGQTLALGIKGFSNYMYYMHIDYAVFLETLFIQYNTIFVEMT